MGKRMAKRKKKRKETIDDLLAEMARNFDLDRVEHVDVFRSPRVCKRCAFVCSRCGRPTDMLQADWFKVTC